MHVTDLLDDLRQVELVEEHNDTRVHESKITDRLDDDFEVSAVLVL